MTETLTPRGTCSAPLCDKKSVARRLCRAHYQQAWKAGNLDSHQTLPPRSINATVCPDGHRHGSSGVCYVHHKCRCEDCRTSHSRRNLRRKRLQAYGQYDNGLVDIEPVREHLLMLGEFGMGYKRVAAVAGVGVTITRNIIWGRQDPGPRKGEMLKHVKRETADAILGVRPEVDHLTDGARIPSRSTHRRLQALVARGWSQSKLASRLGMLRSNFGQMMQRPHVSVRLHRATVELYDELWDITPPKDEWRDRIAYSRSIKYASERRWLPPLAWDDIDTDEEPPVVEAESGEIDQVAVDLACAGEGVRLSVAERRAAVTILNGRGHSDSVIAERLRIADRTVLRIRQELGLAPAVDAGGNLLKALA
jgi:hypothetical protein